MTVDKTSGAYKKEEIQRPKTGKRFDTMEELKILRKKIQKEKRSRIKYRFDYNNYL